MKYEERPLRASNNIYYDETDEQLPKMKPKKKRKKKKTSVIKNIFLSFLLLIFLGAAAAAVAVTMFVVKIADDLPTSVEMTSYKINVPSVIYDRNHEIVAKLFTENRNPVPMNEISPWMIKSVLAAEDSDFYSHHGISLQGIARAIYVDILLGGKLQGGSTITQQLARNLFLTHERSIVRKIKEMIISIRMEKLYSKDKLLEMYLNTIYFGQGAWGVDTAAHTYFGKPSSELSLAEASILAGLVPAPNRYNPLTNLESAKNRQSYVIDRMVTLGWIDERQAAEAKKEELIFKHVPNKAEEYNRAPYFVSHILFSDLLPKYGADMVYGGGMEIYTTIDIRLQEKAQAVVANMKEQGALVAIEPTTGEVISLVGGKDFKQSKFNRATQAFRQPGSSFKPFIYAAAVNYGLRPSDHFIDDALLFEKKGGDGKPWSPGNYDGKFHGEVTMLQALTKSYNTVPVRVAAYIGTEPILDIVRAVGITSPHVPNDLSVALGSASVTPLEMALGFCVFSNSGRRPVKPIMIREVRSWTGDILETSTSESVDALKPETAWTLQSMMLDVVRAGTGGRAAIPGVEVYGKTGTTNDFIDAWFIGGVPGLVAAVYAGKDDHKTLGRNQTGGVVAAPPWKDYMSFAVDTLGLEKHFDVPNSEISVDRVSLCRDTGYLATSGCPGVSIYVEAGTGPTSSCPVHGGDGSTLDDGAPRLVTIAQDSELLDKYTVIAPTDAPIVESQPVVPDTPTVYRNDPSPAEVVEDRYQKLLKEYGIK